MPCWPCCICCARLCAPRRSASSARPCASTALTLLLAPLVLALAERLVAQVLLLADHVAELVERRHHIIVHVVAALLAGTRHLQVFQHLLQLFEHSLCRILGARTRELLHPV